MADVIFVSEHEDLLAEILARYGVPRDWLEITSDIAAWCEQRGLPESNPFRAAKCFMNDSRCQILLRELQTTDMVNSAISYMELIGFTNEFARLKSDGAYLAHLLLHEIACFVLQTTEQAPRDAWAFAELSSFTP